MTDGRLVDALAGALGWRKAPGRYLKSGRSWIPESRFRPLVDLRDAFRLLDALSNDYLLLTVPGSAFTAEVRLTDRTGTAAGEPKARVISLAIARALGIDVEAERLTGRPLDDNSKLGQVQICEENQKCVENPTA